MLCPNEPSVETCKSWFPSSAGKGKRRPRPATRPSRGRQSGDRERLCSEAMVNHEIQKTGWWLVLSWLKKDHSQSNVNIISVRVIGWMIKKKRFKPPTSTKALKQDNCNFAAPKLFWTFLNIVPMKKPRRQRPHFAAQRVSNFWLGRRPLAIEKWLDNWSFQSRCDTQSSCCSPYRLGRWAFKFPNFFLDVWVAVSFQPCNFRLLRIPKAFGCLQELTVFLGKSSQKQAMHLPRIGGGGVWTLLLWETLQTCLDGILKTLRLEEGILAPENGLAAHMLLSGLSKVFNFTLAFHAIEIIYHKGAFLWYRLFNVGDPFGPPSAAPWLLFAIERSAPALAMQVLQLLLCRNWIMKPIVFRPFRQKHHSCTDIVSSAAGHQVVPGGGILARPWAHSLPLWQHITLEHNGVVVGGEDGPVKRPLGWLHQEICETTFQATCVKKSNGPKERGQHCKSESTQSFPSPTALFSSPTKEATAATQHDHWAPHDNQQPIAAIDSKVHTDECHTTEANQRNEEEANRSHAISPVAIFCLNSLILISLQLRPCLPDRATQLRDKVTNSNPSCSSNEASDTAASAAEEKQYCRSQTKALQVILQVKWGHCTEDCSCGQNQ